jgi:hypothetical protein
MVISAYRLVLKQKMSRMADDQDLKTDSPDQDR